MARSCEELIQPDRYGVETPVPIVLLAHVKLLWPPSSGEAIGEETPISVGLVDLRPTSTSRAFVAMQQAALMEGEVTVSSLQSHNWAADFADIARNRSDELVHWVLVAPSAAIQDLAQLVDAMGGEKIRERGGLILVTDRPDLVDATKFDVVVSADSSTVHLVAARVFRMINVLTAGTTLACVDFSDVAVALSQGQRVKLVTAYWDDKAQALLVPDASDKSSLVEARGLFWADHLPHQTTSLSRTFKIVGALKAICADDVFVIFGIAVGQRADAQVGPVFALDVLVSY